MSEFKVYDYDVVDCMSMVGKPCDIQYDPSIVAEDYTLQFQQLYEKLIIGSIAGRAISKGCSNLSAVIPTIQNVFDWLRSTDFYSSPASTKYHEAYPHGLLVHTLLAYDKMVELHMLKSFESVDINSATLVILTHDWCKIHKYTSYFKKVPDAAGNWVNELAYTYNKNYLGLGHGPQSLMMVSQLCNNRYTYLSFEEMAAIRWHMYTYDVTSYDINDLNNCNTKIPLVLMTQFADQLAVNQF